MQRSASRRMRSWYWAVNRRRTGLSGTAGSAIGRPLAAAETIELSRDITYDDAQVLAKSAEEQLLYRDMDDSAARRIMRRLQSIGPGS